MSAVPHVNAFVASPVVIDFARVNEPVSDVARKVRADAKGKGGIKEIAIGKSDMYRVNPYDLAVKDDYNSRTMDSPENKAHIDWLAQSIAKKGVIVPLEVYNENGKFFVSDGFCRYFATMRAMNVYGVEIRSVPVVTVPKGSNEVDRLLSQVFRNSGKPLTALEQGSNIKRVLALGWTPDQVAEEISRSVQHVNNLLELQEAPEAVKKMIERGEVKATLAQNVIRSSNSATAAVKTLREAVKTAKSQGKTKATAKHVSGGALTPAKELKEFRAEMSEVGKSALLHEGPGKLDLTADEVAIVMDKATFAQIREVLGFAVA